MGFHSSHWDPLLSPTYTAQKPCPQSSQTMALSSSSPHVLLSAQREEAGLLHSLSPLPPSFESQTQVGMQTRQTHLEITFQASAETSRKERSLCQAERQMGVWAGRFLPIDLSRQETRPESHLFLLRSPLIPEEALGILAWHVSFPAMAGQRKC